MPIVKIAAGNDIETLSRDELDDALTKFAVSWRREQLRGFTTRRISRQGTADAAGAIRIGGADSPTEGLGPAEGMVWSVTRLGYTNAAGTPVVALSLNGDQPSDFVRALTADVNGNHYAEYGSNALLLDSGDVLLITGTGITAGTVVTVSGAAVEVPFNLRNLLLGAG